MERLICVIIGYALGLIETGYFYGKLHHVDIRQKGSGNVGTTNALRTLGWKAGLVTFLGDCFKCIIAVVIVHLIYGRNHADMVPMLAMYAGLGAVLGHNYPFYMKFKGGKGIAVAVGCLFVTFGWIGACLELLIFIVLVVATKRVSVGSIAAAAACPFFALYFFWGDWLAWLFCTVAGLTVVWAHRENIKRLRAGTESWIGDKGKKKEA